MYLIQTGFRHIEKSKTWHAGSPLHDRIRSRQGRRGKA